MSLVSGVVLYGMIWFMTLFVVLPIGFRSQADMGTVVPGTPASAPFAMKFGRKMLVTTIFATLIWGVTVYIILGEIITRADVESLHRMFRG